jgi:outer membrane lipoprotein-sorting protein
MTSWLLLCGLALSARAAPAPDALELLRRSQTPPQTAYAAEFSVERGAGGKAAARRVVVRFSPPDLYRREVLGPSGRTLQLVVEDGKTEWISVPARRRVWQGAPADPLAKRFGPDEELERLAENYELELSDGGKIAGRPAWLVALRSRSDGSLARRLWLDRSSALVLRGESFRPDGSLAGTEEAKSLRWGAQDPDLFRFSPPPGSTVVKRTEPDYLALDEARAAGLEPRLPAWLPAGYVFESLDVMAKGRRSVLHVRFSDGIEVLSLFQCPPQLRFDLGGRPRRSVRLKTGRGFRTSTAEGNVLSWSSGGGRFILIGAASGETLRRVAESIR